MLIVTYISDLSCIQNIIYLTANFVFIPIQINLKKTNKRKEITSKFYFIKVNMIYR